MPYRISLQTQRQREVAQAASISREQLARLVDQSPWQVAYLDVGGRYVYANEQYASFFGRTQAALAGQRIEEVLPEEARDQVRALFDRALAGDQAETLVKKAEPGGLEKTYHVCYSPFFSGDGRVEAVGIYYQDISAQREREQAQMLQRMELEEQVQDRTARLERTIQNLEKEVEDRRRMEQELRQMEATLVERVSAHSRKLAGLYEVLIAGTQAEETGQLLEHTLAQACHAMECQAMAIHEWQGPALRLLSHFHLPSATLSCIGVLDGAWLSNPELPLPVDRLDAECSLPEAIRQSGFGAYLAVPVRQKGKIVGLMGAFCDAPRSFSVEDLSLASAIAEELGVILENLQLRQRIEEAIVIKERRRLARDLHDSVTQSLHSLVLSAHTASNRLKQGDLTRLETSLDQLSEAARHALKEMRLLLYEMRLVPLQQVDMVEALHMRLEMVEGRAGIDGRLEVADGASWPKAWEGDLFCIASEALNNSLKYGQAAAVTVRLRGDPASLYLEIVDNGRGFDPQRFTGGMGLINMRERAERLGGRMEIHSAPGHGARIVLQTGGFKE